jgi:hypothetical protein
MVQLIKRWLSYAVFGRQSYRFTNKKILGFRQLQTGPIKFWQKAQIFYWKIFFKLFSFYVYHSDSKSYWKVSFKYSQSAIGMRPKTKIIVMDFVFGPSHLSSVKKFNCNIELLRKSSMKEIETAQVVDS